MIKLPEQGRGVAYESDREEYQKSAHKPNKNFTGGFNSMRTIVPSESLKCVEFMPVKVLLFFPQFLIEGQFMHAGEKTGARITF